MIFHRLRRSGVLIALLCLLAGGAAHADGPGITTLHTFNGPGTYGAFPYTALTAGRDGAWYGTTASGGLGFGTLFRITPSGQMLTLFRFNGANGGSPRGALTLGTDGSFYGTTQSGGRGNSGTVFRFTPGGHLVTLLHFPAADGSGKNMGGAAPEAAIVQAATDGSMYGVTSRGGQFGGGVVFRLPVGGGIQIVHEFAGPEGFSPVGPLVQAGGSLYGVTFSGGLSDQGTIFRINAHGAVLLLHSFNGAYGAYPFAGLTLGRDGALYGTTYAGGLGYGTAYKITPSGRFTTLHKFSQDGHGTYPFAGLTLGADGSFYGTTAYGGENESDGDLGGGTVFQMTPAGRVTSLYKFRGDAHGSTPFGGVVIGPSGFLYGTTAYGGVVPGSYGDGTVYRLAFPTF